MAINTMDGPSNLALFLGDARRGWKPPAVTTVWNSISEPELSVLFRASQMVGDCTAGVRIFESLGGKENHAFVERFRKCYGASERVNDPMETADFGVYMWKNAVAEAAHGREGVAAACCRG